MLRKLSRTILSQLLICSAFFSLFGASQANAETIERIAAVVDDRVLTFQDIRREVPVMELMQQRSPDVAWIDDSSEREVYLRRYLDEMVTLRLLEQRAGELKSDGLNNAKLDAQIFSKWGKDDIEKQLQPHGITVDQYRDFMRGKLKADFVMQTEIDRQVTIVPLEVEACAREVFPTGKVQKKLTLREIRIPLPAATPELAAKSQFGRALYENFFESITQARYSSSSIIYEKITQGSVSFEEMARTYSFFNRDLGGLHRSQYTREEIPVLDKAFDLNEGEVTEPLESLIGFHIVKVEKLEEVTNPGWEKQKQTCRAKLRHEGRLKFLEGWVANQRAKHFVQVHLFDDLKSP